MSTRFHAVIGKPGSVALRLVAALVLVLATLALVPGSPAAAAPPNDLEVSAEVTGNVLLGEAAEVRVTARNTGSVDQYNLSFRYVLPAGVTYVPGSSNAALGEPKIINLPAPGGGTVLIWSNVSDLPLAATQALTFRVLPDKDVFPVGSTIPTDASAYTNTNERTVPKFNGSGTYTTGADNQGTAPQERTSVSAIKVEKSEPSPEHELVRGVHEHPTTYALKVTNNGHYADRNVVLVDYLPAQLEFLGCGDVDNTAGADVEYAGAPRLDAVADLTANCPTPFSVTTVKDPAGYPGGVYTRVEWHLADLAPGDTTTVRYLAGIPMRANQLFPEGAEPSATSGEQGANLDNNTGASTRETDSEQGLTNHVGVSADYAGPVAGGGSTRVADEDTLTVTAEDLAVQKSVSPTTFTHGGIATFTFELQTGEYARADQIVLTDVLPDGLCPLRAEGQGISGCTAAGSQAPTGASYDTVTANADGTHTIVFTPVTMPESGTHTVTFQALMGTTYRQTGAPTVAGDSYVNTVSLTGTTTSVNGLGHESGTQAVEDESRATLTGGEVKLDKRILPQDGSTPYTCAKPAGDYKDTAALLTGSAAERASVTFAEGSRVCFLLDVTFPTGTDTKNPVLKDFLPENLTYEAGSAQPAGGNNLPAGQVTITMPSAGPVFTLGETKSGGRFVTQGGRFVYVLSAIVNTPAAPGEVDVPGNLAKLTWTDTKGKVSFLRDQEDFRVPSPPPIAIDKTASATSVVAGDQVDFSIALSNNGNAANGNAVDIVGPTVWDVLPQGIACADLVSGVGTAPRQCFDPTSAGRPTYAGNGVRSVVIWELPDTVRIAPGATLNAAITYRVTYPATIAAGASYTNTAHVRDYGTENNLGVIETHYPKENVDTTVPADEQDAPPANDNHTVTVPKVELDKSNDTSVDDALQGANPGTTNYAVPGETVTYTIEAKLPKNTTVYGGKITDALPSHVVFDELVAVEHKVGAGGWATAPASVVPSTPTYVAATKVLTATLATPLVIGAEDQWVRLTVRTHIDVGSTGVHNQTRVNTARFDSTNQAGGSLTQVTDTSTITLVEPQPVVDKTVTPTNPGAGQSVTYTITAKNNRQPVLHDSVLVDCVPAGINVDSGSITPSRGTAAVVASPGCAAGATRIEWTLGDLPNTQPWPTLTYTATVDPAAGSAATYVNTVTETGTSMPGTPPGDKSYAATDDATLTVPSSTITKSVTPTRAPVGDRVTFTVDVELPRDAHFYDARVVDTLPAGIDPASLQDVDVTCTDSGGSCTVPTPTSSTAGQVVTWSFGHIPTSSANRTLQVTYTAVVRSDTFGSPQAQNDAGETLTNSVRFLWKSASGDTTDKQTGPATSTATVLEPRLSITKAVSKANPVHGEEFTYTVTVTNATGANVSTAHDIDLTDTVPAGVKVTAGSISGGGALNGGATGGGTITWSDLGPLAAGDSITLTYKGTLVSGTKTGQTNTVDITEYHSLPSNEGGGRTYDGPEDDATVTPALPELTVSKTLLDPAPAYRGKPVRWRIEVTNKAGAPTAHDVDIVDTLPAGWTYDDDSAMVSIKGAAATQVNPAISGQALTWTNLADLAGGESIVIDLIAIPGASAAVGSGTAHVNTAATSGKDLEGGVVVTEDEDDAQTRIDSADVQIVKAVTPSGAKPVAGDDFSWTLTVTNNGGDVAVGPFTVTDTLPDGVTFVSADGGGWTCHPPVPATPSEFTCERTGTLAKDASFAPITVTGTLDADLVAGTEITNNATVSAETYDPDKDNNKDDERSTVTTIADFGIDKALNGTLVPGRDATYAITVTNHGPSYSQGAITVTETLPAGLTYKSFTGTGWKLDNQSGQVLTFVWDGAKPVGIGALPVINVTASVASSLTTAVTNRVTVEEPTDPTSGPEEPDSKDVPSTPAPSADLSLEKTHVGPMTAGTTDTYSFTVTNHGPSDAAGPLTLVDDLPAGLTYVAGSATSGWTCTPAGQVLTCTRPAGLVAQTAGNANQATFTIDVEIDQALTGSVVNRAEVTSPTPDPVTPNNEDDDDSSTSADVKADLQITKTLTTPVADVIAGTEITYELTVKNNGPSQSKAPIEVADVLPSGLSFVSAVGTGWTCGHAGGTITCERNSVLASGATAPVITVKALIASGIGAQTLVNTASVDGPDPDPNPNNNNEPEDTPVTEDTEIKLTKTNVGDNPVRAGEVATFEIRVTSSGPSDARQVVVSDVLPTGMTLVSAIGTDWTCTSAGVCTIDRIVPGTPAPPLTIKARVASGVPHGTTLTNEASATTATPGDDPADNEDDADVDVVAVADLALEKKHSGAPVVAGTPTDYTLTVVNNGPSDAIAPLTVTDTLPAGMSYLSAGAPWSCAPPTGQTVTCTLAQGLVAGQTAPALQMSVMVAADAESAPATNSAHVESPTTDDKPGNNTDDETVPVTRATNLRVTKSHTGTAHIGDELSFAIAVHNEGPSTARDVVVTDTLPVGLEFVSATGTDWTCTAADGVVTCTLAGRLASGADAPPITVVTVVRPAAYPWVQNVAEVGSSTPETDPEDNRDTDPVDVPALVDLAVTKELVGDLVVGQEGRYRLTVTNNGPTDDPEQITLTDVLPAGLAYRSAAGDGWDCAESGGTVTCTRPGGLAAGETSIVEVIVLVEPSAWPGVLNQARVETPSEDKDPDNDTDEVESDVTPTVDLSLDKSVASQKRGLVTYRLTVRNGGPSATVAPLVVTDRLPKGLEYVAAHGKGWSCVVAGQLVTCTYVDPLPAGAEASFLVEARIVAKPGESIRNVAQLDGGDEGTDGPTTDDDDAVVKVPPVKDGGDDGDEDGTDSGLPNAGGPALWILVAGLGLLGGGLLLIRRRRA
ncbi:isopeptide-forming domain-containing fimbrial protein [Nocardioides daejeonensis]|uniref:isopeptide-forming domain-containing fimbrial protein n=1 Tax=Nocardioides daejeonensis TaxID=1046556 RepID=UPI000D74495F|nr:isopeptide-forming domain-containing fimbrial protein [Nocardioides daejeonensis]